MSSADMDITCPNCQYEEANQSWNSRGYTHTFCPRCGYTHELTHEDGKEETKGGVGSFCMTYSNGARGLGGLAEAKSIRELKRMFRKAMRTLTVKRIEVTLLQRGLWETVVLKDFPQSSRKKIQKRKGAKGELVFEDLDPDIAF